MSTLLGASSTTFWWRRWMLHSRSNRYTTLPWWSASTCTSMWRGPRAYFSTNTASSPKALRASLWASSIISSNSSARSTSFMPLPPPPSLALISTGKPMSMAVCLAACTSVMAVSKPGTRGTLYCLAAALAASLLPIRSMASALGPTKVRPAACTARAKPLFSLKKP